MIETAFMCLALNIYFEARNQPISGQIAVAQVVLNRVAHQRYPSTICAVVKQGPTRPSWRDKNIKIPIKHRCQFSWYCDGKSDKPKELDAFRWASFVAHGVMQSDFTDYTHGATHYHSIEVFPRWALAAKKIDAIGDHIFYKY
tara:strand:+ start:1241 stop:1669 length:429 start_codon:yes stop_codon:yes gene_type:complete